MVQTLTTRYLVVGSQWVKAATGTKFGRSSIGIDTSFPASTPTRVGQPKLQYRPPRKANRYRRKSSAVANSSEGNRPLEQWNACNLAARIAGRNRFRKSSSRGNAFKNNWSPINKNSKIANHLNRLESRNVTTVNTYIIKLVAERWDSINSRYKIQSYCSIL